MTISLIQGPIQGSASAATGNFTISITPTAGNVLVLTFLGQAGGTQPTVTSISQTNVAWGSSPVVQENGAIDLEIWIGVVSASPGGTITVNFGGGTGGLYGEMADVCEWHSTLGTLNSVDKTAANPGAQNKTTDTGTTPTTTVAEELWIGATGAEAGSIVDQSAATNGFNLLDGVTIIPVGGVDISIGYLYKIVSSTGTADSGTTIADTAFWVGCIATFFVAAAGNTMTLTGKMGFNQNPGIFVH